MEETMEVKINDEPSGIEITVLAACCFTNMVGCHMDGPGRDRVLRLMDEKDRIESEIRDQMAILETSNVTMTDALVDAQGYPRNDIDVYKVRHARHRIICLQNDHKTLMKRIEQGLSEIHSDFVGPNGEGPTVLAAPPASAYTNGHASGHTNGHANGHTNVHANGHNSVHVNENQPGFATVGRVQEGSPADVAGLSEDDELLQFGSITSSNFTELPQIFNVVSNSVGQNVLVRLRRDGRVMQLTVVPRPWAEPGLLGCHIRRR